MSPKLVIIDTNVLVAGLLTSTLSSPPAQILDGMLSASFSFVLSEPLLAEYRSVSLRPALRKQHGLTETEIDTLLIDIALNAIVLSPAIGPTAPDPGDQLLWDLLAVRSDLLLVTGDIALQEDSTMRERVMSPRSFIEDVCG